MLRLHSRSLRPSASREVGPSVNVSQDSPRGCTSSQDPEGRLRCGFSVEEPQTLFSTTLPLFSSFSPSHQFPLSSPRRKRRMRLLSWTCLSSGTTPGPSCFSFRHRWLGPSLNVACKALSGSMTRQFTPSLVDPENPPAPGWSVLNNLGDLAPS